MNLSEPRVIEIGPTTGDLTIIVTGLREGEQVGTDGQYKLRRAGRVSFTASRAFNSPCRTPTSRS